MMSRIRITGRFLLGLAIFTQEYMITMGEGEDP